MKNTYRLKLIIQKVLWSIIFIHISYIPGYPSQEPGIFLSTLEGDILMEQNSDKQYTPASILKILTGYAAISHFGKKFRFPTQGYFDEPSCTLYIKGLGDPLFISESIQNFCDYIWRQTNIRTTGKIKQIVVDQNFFAPDIHIPGTGKSHNPYDAAVGALCANFNTVSFCRDPSTGKFISAEAQTPLLEECIKEIREAGTDNGRILLPPHIQQIYPGLLVQYFMGQKGIHTKGIVKIGSFPQNFKIPPAFQSDFSLDTVVQKLLQYSNNLIANQLLLTLGADIYGPPATIEKGTRAIKNFAKNTMGIKISYIAEGSGISRQNKITPHQMGIILQHFDPMYSLLRENDRTYYKTGTLNGVRCLAGYIKGKKNPRYPFTIMINKTIPKGISNILQKLIHQIDEYEKTYDKKI